MNTRTLLLTSLATAALLSGPAFAQDADAETDGETITTTVPIQPMADSATEGSEEGDDATLTAEGESEAVEIETEAAEGEDALATEDDAEMAEGAEPLAEEGDSEMAAEAEPLETEGDAEMAEGDEPVAIEEESDMASETETETMTVPVEETADAEPVETEVGTEDTTVAEGETEMEADSTGLFGTFAQMRVADLIGMNVLAMDGDDVGEVDQLVSFDGEPNAIIGVGGFLGLFEHDVAIPLQSFQLVEDGLMLPDVTEDEIEAMQEWDGETGTEMQSDLTVEEAS